MKEVNIGEKKTAWKELLKSFFSSDEQLEEEKDREEIEFNREYSDILSKTKSEVSSLEEMLHHSDIKVTKRPRRTKREQTKLQEREAVFRGKEHEIDEQER